MRMPLKGKSLIREERCQGIQSSSNMNVSKDKESYQAKMSGKMKPTIHKPWITLKEWYILESPHANVIERQESYQGKGKMSGNSRHYETNHFQTIDKVEWKQFSIRICLMWILLKGKRLIREDVNKFKASNKIFSEKCMPYVNTLNGRGLIREREMSWNWKRCQYEYIKGEAFHNCKLTFSMNWNDYGGLIDFRPCNMNMSKDEDFMMQILVGINNKDV